MKETNITEQIKQLHLEERATQISEDVIQDLKSGTPQSLKDELSSLIRKCHKPEGRVIQFPGKTIHRLAEIDLLAAASKQVVGDLVSQPLVCLSKGFSVDIRRVLGSENEVTLYFLPVDEGEHQMEEIFSPYRGQTIFLEFVLNGVQLLNCSIYVDESARQAEGEGILVTSNVDMKDPRLEINVSSD
jgi:hypothetical protein